MGVPQKTQGELAIRACLREPEAVIHCCGSVTETAIFDDYVNRLLQQADAGDLSIVWDCGNGAAGPATVAMTKKLTGTHQVLFADIDGHFPNHHPNPAVVNLVSQEHRFTKGLVRTTLE